MVWFGLVWFGLVGLVGGGDVKIDDLLKDFPQFLRISPKHPPDFSRPPYARRSPCFIVPHQHYCDTGSRGFGVLCVVCCVFLYIILRWYSFRVA